MKKNPIPFLRKLGLIEGISFLLLMGVAMPLKYIWGMPTPVKIVGWAHGVLFVSLCVSLLQTMIVAKWSLKRGALIFIAAIVPFGPFLIDRRVKGYEKEFHESRTASPSESPVLR
ncbi:MAG: DUF3817 domain-containing protein [Verrucomicrobia bacterium]|nr:DUF3817 domain-containing protein [Verrucomicrobiota bacterium]